jgi:cellulose synthase/poly-beta-1,6-N-acetylglucosamine synthase-like glycosyltransferase
VERARGDCVVFFDADVLVRPETLTHIAVLFSSEPSIAAAFGAYDDQPPASGVVSQYRNLLHHFTHVANAGEAYTFWSGCGAVRREVFLEAGMYDEWRFSRPQVEDIELGHRIRALGYRIVLRPEIQVTHLKRWTLKGMIAADFNDRGVPWARLLIEQHVLLSVSNQQAQTLNLRLIEKINTVLVWLALALFLAGAWLGISELVLAAPALLLPLLWTNRLLYRLFYRYGGLGFTLLAIPLHGLYYIVAGVSVIWGGLLANLLGEPRPDPSTEALAEIGLNTWPPVPYHPKRSSVPVIIPSE